MPIETIEVQYVNQPRAGAKQGNVKDKEGRYFGVWPEQLQNYQPGGVYEIEYDSKNYNGKTYKTISRIIQSTPPNAGGMASSKSDTKAVEMAVMGIFRGIYEGTGTVPSEAQMAKEMRAIKNAWTWAFSGQADITQDPFAPPKTAMSGMDDEIPF